MITVGDIMKLHSIQNARLICDVDSAARERMLKRSVSNVGVLDVGPHINKYDVYHPGELILTNLGFAKSVEETDAALTTLIQRGVAGIGIKTVYDPHFSELICTLSRDLGIPVFLYEGEYHEHVIYEALTLIQHDNSLKAKEELIDAVMSSASNRIDTKKLAVDLDITAPYIMCVALSFPPSVQSSFQRFAYIHDIQQRLNTSLETEPIYSKTSIYQYRDHLLMWLGVHENTPEAKHTAKSLIERLFPQNTIGMSLLLETSLAHIALRQANDALEGQKEHGIQCFEHMGLEAFKTALQSNIEYKMLAQSISAIFKDDYELYRTAQSFVENKGDVAQTSKALSTHTNTLRYRLSHLKTLLNKQDCSNRELFAYLTLIFMGI